MNAFPGVYSSSSAKAAQPLGKRHIYLLEEFNNFLSFAKVGFFVLVPLLLAIFSIWYALAFISFCISAYAFGKFVQEFAYWYNARIVEIEREPEPPRTTPPTEVEEIFERILHFERKYYFGISDMFRYLESGKIPIQDNLDWIEIVSLLNRLSLNVGKHFQDDTKKGKK